MGQLRCLSLGPFSIGSDQTVLKKHFGVPRCLQAAIAKLSDADFGAETATSRSLPEKNCLMAWSQRPRRDYFSFRSAADMLRYMQPIQGLSMNDPKPTNDFQDVIQRRRSTRKFEAGREVEPEVLDRIVECGRWAPSGANVQCWDFIVVRDPEMREEVRQVFLRQAQRLVDHAKGFPAVSKNYLSNTVAIVIVLGDPRWKVCFPQPTSQGWEAEYLDNNEAIFLCSLGAAVQNIQLGVTAEGLTSAWLSGGGEEITNRELSNILGYPDWMKAYGTIPIGYPVASQDRRYRRPLDQVRHWDRYNPEQYRRHEQVDFYESTLRPFAMYRDQEDLHDWPDFDEKLGDWADAFTDARANPSAQLEKEADFSKPRTSGKATKARQRSND